MMDHLMKMDYFMVKVNLQINSDNIKEISKMEKSMEKVNLHQKLELNTLGITYKI
jgi:hypothetical protein